MLESYAAKINFQELTSDNITALLCIGLIIFCVSRTLISAHAAKNKIVDNGAQTVVTLGVLFTFVGIAFSLWHFDTNPDKMAQELEKFLAGMKIAFFTSIIGMVFGRVIKHIQAEIEAKGEKEALDNLVELKAVRLALTEITQNNERQNQQVVAAIDGLKASVQAGSSENLIMALMNFSQKMDAFVTSSETAQRNMELLIENTRKQSTEMSGLITDSITTLTQKIAASGENQAQQLAVMNGSITAMGENSAQSAKFAEALLSDTRAYQQNSLMNDDKAAEILRQNTATIDGMRQSFDKFLQDMAENYSNELINALNMSMEKLNTQLQTQFGDNFRQLNEAVKDVVTWQQEYKEIVEKTTVELNTINETFGKFQAAVAGEVDAHIAAMTANLKEFTDTSRQNVGIQQNLRDATRELGDMIATARENVSAMQRAAEQFGELSAKTNENINRAFADQNEQMVGHIAAFAAQLAKVNETAFGVVTDVNHYLRDFGTVSDDVTKSIRETLEAFRADFAQMTKTELQGLQAVFKQMAENTDKQ